MSWQSAIACWLLRKQFRPETLNPHVSVERARAHAASRVWRPKVPAGWRLVVRDRRADAPLCGEWLERECDSERGAPVRTGPTTGLADVEIVTEAQTLETIRSRLSPEQAADATSTRLPRGCARADSFRSC